jgi:hypothetical protein
MTEEAGRHAHAHASPKSVRFARLPAAALTALLNRDLAGASLAAGVPLTGYFITPEALKLWRMRADQIAADPQSARWIARAAVAEPEGFVVGHAGFHGPPDAAGMVEVGNAPRAAAARSQRTRRQDRARDDQPGQRRVAGDDRRVRLHRER